MVYVIFSVVFFFILKLISLGITEVGSLRNFLSTFFLIFLENNDYDHDVIRYITS